MFFKAGPAFLLVFLFVSFWTVHMTEDRLNSVFFYHNIYSNVTNIYNKCWWYTAGFMQQIHLKAQKNVHNTKKMTNKP